MNKLIELVEELNEDLCENNLHLYQELGICYSYSTNGFVEIIDFMGTDIYNSEYKKYDDNDEPIEPTIEFIKNEVKDLIFEIIKGL